MLDLYPVENNKSTKIKKFLDIKPDKIQFISLHGRNRFENLCFQYPSIENTPLSINCLDEAMDNGIKFNDDPIFIEFNHKLFEINNWIITEIKQDYIAPNNNIEVCEISLVFDKFLEIGTIH